MTKETEKALKILYCEFKRRRKNGLSKANALEFKDGSIPEITAFKEWMREDISYAINELGKSGYVKENILGDVTLTESALKFMEDKPKEFFSALSGFFDLIGLFA